MDKYGSSVRFVCVYVMEAHATDQWPLGKISTIPQHKNFSDRVSAAKILQENFSFRPELYVDTMDNVFNSHYCAWPERGFVVMAKNSKEGNKEDEKQIPKHGIIQHLSLPQLDGSIEWELEVEEWLKNHFGY